MLLVCICTILSNAVEDRAPFDGWAGDVAVPGQYKDYYYPNAQNARTIWYHVSLDVACPD
jgi:hypothetical protein